MSELAKLVLRYVNDPSCGRALELTFKAECLRALAGRLIAGQYTL